MKVVRGDRQSGKTRAVIEWFMEDPKVSTIVCFDQVEAERLARALQQHWLLSGRARMALTHQHPLYWLGQKHIITIRQLLDGALNGTRITRVAFDNVDYMLHMLAGPGRDAQIVTIGPGRNINLRKPKEAKK